jgi:hypothetical protein
MIPVTYQSLEGVLVVGSGLCSMDRYIWGMIRSDLHGAESPTDGCYDPTGGKEKPEACTKKKEGRCTRDTLIDLDPGGFCLSTWTLTLEST